MDEVEPTGVIQVGSSQERLELMNITTINNYFDLAGPDKMKVQT